MRKAFTLVEMIIILAIIVIIAAIAISNSNLQSGNNARWNGQNVRIVACDTNTSPTTFLIRLEDNKEMRVTRDELTPIVKTECEQ